MFIMTSNSLNKIIYLGVFLIIFLFPTYLIRFEVLNIPTTLLEILIYIVFLLWFLYLFFDRENTFQKRLKKIFFRNKLLFYGILLLVLGALAASVLSVDLRVSFGLFKAYFIDPLLFFTVFISVVLKEDIKKVVVVFLASGIGVSLVSIIYFLSGKLTYDGRLEGFFNSPNFLAMSLSPVILFLVWVLFSKYKYFASKLVWFSVLVLVVIPFLLTYSYGAFLGVFVALVLIIGLSQVSIKVKFASILALLVISFSLFLFQADNEKTKSFLIKNDRSSLVSRNMIWSASSQILKDNYIFGIGPGMFQKYYLAYQNKFKEPYLEWAVPYPHNIFLSFWIQTGIIGFLGFLLILIWIIKVYIKSSSKTILDRDFEKSVNVLVLAFFVYFLMHGLLDTPFWKNDLALTFFFFIGILIVVFNKESTKIKNRL